MLCVYRVDRCREAFSQCQGLMLFGSNIKLTLMDVDGKLSPHLFTPRSNINHTEDMITFRKFVGAII